MNFSQEMVPGICALLVGALFCFGAEKLCRKKKDVPTVKVIGAIMAVCGAILIFVP